VIKKKEKLLAKSRENEKTQTLLNFLFECEPRKKRQSWPIWRF
jgi:hypothetical protein